METATRTGPDLKNGFLVFGSASGNAWTTEILCAVRERPSGGERWHYLSKECRVEGVPFRRASTPTIFRTDGSREFLMAIVDGRAVQLTSSDIAILADSPGNGAAAIEDAPVQPVVMAGEFNVEVHCRDRPVRGVPVAEAVERLRARVLSVRNLFMRAEWSGAEGESVLYCPCRYVNFGPFAGETLDYVQLISGYVMVPVPGAGVQVGYVACALGTDGRTIIEFCGKRYRNVFRWAAERVESEGGNAEVARTLANSLPISATVFDSILSIDGSCELYEYA